MAYSEASDVRQALVPTSDGSLPASPTNTAADLADTQLADAIAEADSLIDGYIGKFYAVPVEGSPTPHPVDYWSRSIAAYYATLTHKGSQDIADNDPVVRRYRDAIGAVKAVGNGHLKLDLPLDLGGGSAVAVGTAINPYVGDLWDVSDFDVAGRTQPGFNIPPEPGFWR